MLEKIRHRHPKEFWIEYHGLVGKGESSDLDQEEPSRLADIADMIEKADADRLAAAVELAQFRGISFDEILDEYEIGTVVH